MIPSLKRVRVRSEQDLSTWLRQNDGLSDPVMLVTQTNPKSADFVSRASVATTLAQHDWTGGRRYTLSKTLLGHVVQKSVQ